MQTYNEEMRSEPTVRDKRKKGLAEESGSPVLNQGSQRKKQKVSPTSVPKKLKFEVPTAKFDKIFSIDKLGDPDHAREMKSFYDENGIVCIHLGDKINTRQAVREFVTSIFRQMPYRKEFLLNFKLKNKKEIHIDNDEDIDDIVNVLLDSRITSENLRRLKNALPPHATFGAPCTPPSFHLDIENKIRQDEQLYRAITLLLDNERINCDFNRAIFRVPTVTQGEDFLHFDLDPRAIRSDIDSLIQGKVCITACKFICVPGSNTDEFLKGFNEVYAPLYPGRKHGVAKFAIEPGPVKDPWDLFGKQKAFEIPAGSIVLWSPKILHGHPSFGRETPISIGFYLGFGPEVSKEQREALVKSYKEGSIPEFWPSGDRVHFFPKKFKNFPGMLQKTVVDKLTPKAHEALVTTRTTKLGKEVVDMRPWKWKDGNFTPFQFTPLGLYITGQKEWPK